MSRGIHTTPGAREESLQGIALMVKRRQVLGLSDAWEVCHGMGNVARGIKVSFAPGPSNDVGVMRNLGWVYREELAVRK